MTRVLVTGASGFVGRELVAMLAAKGYAVRAASRVPDHPAPNVERVGLPDLSLPVDWAPLLAGVDAVVHSAAIAHTGAVGEAAYEAVNHRAVASLAQAARGRAVVFLSSIRAQTGAVAAAPLAEEDAPRPDDGYGRSKLAAERALSASGATYVVLRPVLVAGPGARGNLAAMLRLARLPLPLPFATLAARRSVIATSDLCRAVLHVLADQAHIGQTYIVAHPEPISVAAMFSALRAGLGRRPGLVRAPSALLRAGLTLGGQGDAADKLFGDLVASPAKLMATGWTPLTSPRAALAGVAAAA